MATYYLDPTAANNGDGTAHTQAGSPGGTGAFNVLQGLTLAAGDIIWVRRCARAAVTTTITSSYTVSVDNVQIIGWPVSGDENYISRPVAPQSDWDNDVATHAVLKITNSSVQFFFSGDNCELHRLEFYSDTGHSGRLVRFGSSTKTTKMRAISAYINGIIGSGSTQAGLIELLGIINGYELTFDGGAAGVGSNSFVRMTTEAGTFIRFLTITCTGATTSSISVLAAVHILSTGGVIEDFTFQWSGDPANWDTYALRTDTTSDSLVFRRVIIDCTGATQPVSTQIQLQNSSYNNRWYDVRLINCTFNTSVTTVHQANIIEISEWSESTTHTAPIAISARLISLSNTTLNPSNANAYTFGNTVIPGTLLLTRGIIFPNTPILPSTGTYWYSVDHEGNTNDFYCQAAGMRAQSTSIARTGGSSYSLRIEPYNSGANSYHRGLPVFGPEERQAVLLYLTAGAHTVTVYGAYKSFTNNYSNAPTKDHLVVELRSLGDNFSRQVTYSTNSADSFNAALTSDNSTWTGDTGLTAFRLEVPVTTSRDGLVLVDLRAGWPLAETGMIYIDPAPVVS